MSRKTEHMEVPFELKQLEEESGVFEGYASVFGNVDLGNDVVEPGAFKRTLDHSKGAIPILWFHDPTKPVGIGIEATEDAKGLKVRGQLDLNTQLGREMLSGLKMGYIQSMSIGYKAIGKKIVGNVRHLTELALPEYSLLTKGFAMNPEADVTSVKAVADFNATVAAIEAEDDLHRRRWRIEDALRKVKRSIEEDEALDDAAKVDAYREALSQYSDAMAGWFADKLAAEAAAASQGAAEADGYMARADEIAAKLADLVIAGDDITPLADAIKTAPEDGSPEEAPVDGSQAIDTAKSKLALVEARIATLS